MNADIRQVQGSDDVVDAVHEAAEFVSHLLPTDIQWSCRLSGGDVDRRGVSCSE